MMHFIFARKRIVLEHMYRDPKVVEVLFLVYSLVNLGFGF
jgi:hypothetical protein